MRCFRSFLALALLLAVPLLCWSAGAAPVQVAVEPGAPTTEDLISVTLWQDPVCTLVPQRVERFDGGLRIWLQEQTEFPAEPGHPDPLYVCRFLSDPSAVFTADAPGPQRVEVLGQNGELLLQEIVPVGGEPSSAIREMEVVEVPSSTGEVVRVRTGGVWYHTGVPSLDAVVYGDAVVHLYFRGEGDGGSAFTDWTAEALVGPLRPGYYSLVSYTLDPDQALSEALVGKVAYTRVPELSFKCQPNAGVPWLQPDPGLLCLHEDRFRVRAFFTLPGGEEQPATARGLSPRGGAFWFFRPDNPELLVKVLDACAAFDRYWVFVAGLTNVGVRVEVTDNRTGATWSHVSAPGEGFDEVRDTDAFTTCR